MPNALAKIRTEVKRLRKSGMSFRAAQKKAGANYRAGKLGAVRHHTAAKHKRKVSGVVTIGRAPTRMAGLSQKLEQTRDQVHEQLGWLLAAQRTAKTKKEKKALQPRIAKLSRLLKALEK